MATSSGDDPELLGRRKPPLALRPPPPDAGDERGCCRSCVCVRDVRKAEPSPSFPAHLVLAETALFSALSYLPGALRSFLMGLATGTRGSNVVFYNEQRPRKVALTLDDAPSRSVESFAKLLELLKELKVRVSFQVISSHVNSEEHNRLLRLAVAEGHQLTNHSTEDCPCTNLPEAEFERRLDSCQELIEGLRPGSRLWFRPPSGVMSEVMRSVLLRRGYSVCLGDCYSSDPHIENADWHVRTLLRAAEAGSVLILHCPEANSRQQTLQVLPRLVEGLRARNLDLVTLDELFPPKHYPEFVD